MIFVSFLVLMAPGILVWKLCGDQELNTKGSALRALLTILLDDLLILTAAYLALTLVYGRIVISFSPDYDPKIGAGIYHVAFTWKYGILSCGLAVGLAAVKTLFAKVKSAALRKRVKV